MVKRLITVAKARNYKGDGIRSVIYGGGPMYAADIDEALALFGPRFIQIYGQGESPMTITVLPRDIVADEMHPNWRQRRASVGFAQAPVEVAIWGGDLKPVSSGQVGEIVVKGPTVMKGYLDNPQATAETLVNGWLRTGDLGCIDADGFLTLTGRSKDVIISGGSNIYPREVEDVLLQHPGVHEVSVVGAHDPDWGEIVVAFIVPEPGQECRAPGLDEWCRREIAPFKKPKRYHLVESLPKNSYGKVLKTELRALLAGSPK
jgi:long-chain acyl-CoA synthetase